MTAEQQQTIDRGGLVLAGDVILLGRDTFEKVRRLLDEKRETILSGRTRVSLTPPEPLVPLEANGSETVALPAARHAEIEELVQAVRLEEALLDASEEAATVWMIENPY